MDKESVSEALLYKPLPKETLKGKTAAKKGKEKGKKFVETFLYKTLPKGRRKQHEAELEEIKHKALILDRVRPRKKYDLRREKRKTLTSKEKRELGIFKLDPSVVKYDLYLPLHELWKDYMRDLINFESITPKNKSNSEMQLLKADYHGAIAQVTRAKNPSLVGQTGIIIQETKNTFKLVTADDQMKTIPKANCEFSIALEGYLFTIFGNNFQYRSCDRVAKSFKSRKQTFDF